MNLKALKNETYYRLGEASLTMASMQSHAVPLMEELRAIVSDISQQYTRAFSSYNTFYETKMRRLHAFQCSLMLEALQHLGADASRRMSVVDIGDSAGTHMTYLRALAKKRDYALDALSVCLDPVAVKKIEAAGGKALQCRAEHLQLEHGVQLFTCFEMLEHLHDPATFLRKLARSGVGERLAITVPYVKHSRVGLHHLRHDSDAEISAENVHVFELCPEDWRLLMLHAGWKVEVSRIGWQYPRNIPLLSPLLARFWKRTDVEGFWGAILSRDLTRSDRYKDWDE